MITLDTSAIVALADRREADHGRVRDCLGEQRAPYLVPAGILGEVGYLFARRLGAAALDLFLANVQSGALTLDCGQGDLGRIRELLVRYHDLALGLTDATVIACAERSGGSVLTLDRRDFGVVAREGTIHVLPEAA